MMDSTMKRTLMWALAVAAVGLAGCQSGVADQDTAVTGASKFKDTLGTNRPAVAGAEMPADPAAGLPNAVTLAKTMDFANRADPFKLLPEEASFDRSQAAERLNSEFGGFGQQYSEPDETAVQEPQILPKPQWRLAGIIISDGGVIGLLDEGGGQVIQIRPGMDIPGQPYTVVSVDSQRAVLRRTDGMLPHEIQIDLSGPISGASPASGGFGGGGFAPGGGGRPRPGASGVGGGPAGGVDK